MPRIQISRTSKRWENPTFRGFLGSGTEGWTFWRGLTKGVKLKFRPLAGALGSLTARGRSGRASSRSFWAPRATVRINLKFFKNVGRSLGWGEGLDKKFCRLTMGRHHNLPSDYWSIQILENDLFRASDSCSRVASPCSYMHYLALT